MRTNKSTNILMLVFALGITMVSASLPLVPCVSDDVNTGRVSETAQWHLWSVSLEEEYPELIVGKGIARVVKNEAWLSYWEPFGLNGMSVNTLVASEGYLYAGAGLDGVFRKKLSGSSPGNSDWDYLGFEGMPITSLYVNPSFPQVIYVGCNVFDEIDNTSTTDPHSLYMSADGGRTWVASDMGIEGIDEFGIRQRLPVECITGVEVDNHQVLYATSVAHVFKSSDDGRRWSRIYGEEYIPAARGLHTLVVDPSNPYCLWAGGEGGTEWPIIIKSTDGGQTWVDVTPSLHSCNSCYSLAVHSQNSAIVYAGMEGRLLKTIDGGQSWISVLSPPSYPYFRGLVCDPSHPNRIYAGEDPHTLSYPLKVWGGSDGACWRSITVEEAKSVLVLLLDSSDECSDRNRDVLYAGTRGTGVWKCQSTWGPYFEEEDT